MDENKFCNRVIHKFCYDVELTFCSFLSKFTYSKNLKTGTIHLNAHYERHSIKNNCKYILLMSSNAFVNFASWKCAEHNLQYRVQMTIYIDNSLQCVYWTRGTPDNENQSDGRTETIDSNIFKSSQSNVQYKTMKFQFVFCDA